MPPVRTPPFCSGVNGSTSARPLVGAAASAGGATSVSTWGSGNSAAILSDGTTAADGAAAKASAVITVADLAAAATKASAGGGANVTADGVIVAGAHLGIASDSEGEAAGRAVAAAGNCGAFGSVLSPCSPATTEAGAGAADQDSRHGGRHPHRHQGESLLRTAAAQLASKGQDRAAAAASAVTGKASAACHKQPALCQGQQQVPPRKPTAVSPTAALFRRYLHELSMGWPVLGPVVVLLFANISTQVRLSHTNNHVLCSNEGGTGAQTGCWRPPALLRHV
jgi:hypothetical protein